LTCNFQHIIQIQYYPQSDSMRKLTAVIIALIT